MRKLYTALALSAVSVLLLASCASIIKGTKHSLAIGSSPSEARVLVHRATEAGKGLQIAEAVTPATLELSRKHEYLVTISQPGYTSVEVPVLHDGVEGWYYGNILCGGPIGLVVDYVDGAIYKMQPATINVTLEMASLTDRPANELYAVLRVCDEDGQVRSVAVPMIRDGAAH